MNFVWQNQQTHIHLKSWAGSKSLLTPLFFFSVTGTRLQQSVEGLLRSLICQLLESCREVIRRVSQEFSAAPLGTQAFPVWTEATLRQCFRALLRALNPLYRVCIFVDGLDECNGDHRELLRLEFQVANSEDIKICFSSRPEKPFTEFSPPCSLELQDLTKDDMRIYVKTKLDEISQFNQLSSDQASWKDELQQLVIERAQGVFLWVELVTKSQVNGIRDHDDQAALKRKLSHLPGDIEDLYSRLLANIDSYGPEAARYLQFAYDHTPRGDYTTGVMRTNHPSTQGQVDLHVLNFAIAVFGVAPSFRLSSKLNRLNVASRCVEVSQRISITCGGFLELYDTDEFDVTYSTEKELWLTWEPPEIRSTDRDMNWCGQKIRFIHRSAIDFFQTKAKGGQFLKRHAAYSEIKNLWGSSIHLALMKLCNLGEKHAVEEYMLYHVGRLMEIASAAELTTQSQISQAVDLLKYFDNVANKLYRDDSRCTGIRHWSQRWLLPYLQRKKRVFDYDFRRDVEFPSSYAPTDLRSAAAFWQVGWYLLEASEQESMSAARSTHLAVCAAIDCDSLKSSRHLNRWNVRWGIGKNNQIKILMDLIRQGADPNCGIITSIWEELLSSFYWRIYVPMLRTDPNYITDEFRSEALRCFLMAGALPDQIISFDLRLFGLGFRCLSVCIDLDTTLLPFYTRKEEFVGFSANTKAAETRNPTPSNRPLRITFGISKPCLPLQPFDSDSFGAKEDKSETEIETQVQMCRGRQIIYQTRVMTDEQVRELYQLLGGIFYSPRRGKPCTPKMVHLYVPLCRWLQEMHKTCFIEHYEPELWGKLEEYDYLSDDDEDTDDSDYDD